ncbi:YtcA family lipoprotein [Bryocella elongata]|uniref:YtcA family lipoprotein n=1 Tax=Bryocella elongata TaxID=863522 RepID=UPI001F1D6043|nr:YtcA family lipoprotein [Bryocella elongata]
MNRFQRPLTLLAATMCLALAGCGRAPTFDILGSFFPSWLVCIFIGIVLAALVQRLFVRLGIDSHILVPVVVYPCFALLFACVLWLSFFR